MTQLIQRKHSDLKFFVLGIKNIGGFCIEILLYFLLKHILTMIDDV